MATDRTQVAISEAIQAVRNAGPHDTDASLYKKIALRLERDHGLAEPEALALDALNAVAGDSEPDGTLDRGTGEVIT